MTSSVVRGLEPVYVDVSSHELSIETLSTIDLAPDRGKPCAAAASPGQLIGPRILAVLGGLSAIFSRNLAIVAALSTIFGRNLAVVDGTFAAVCCVGAPRRGPFTLVRSPLTIDRGLLSCGSVEITRGAVTGFGLLVTQPGRDVTLPRSQAGLATAHCHQLVCPGIFAIPGGQCAIFGRNPAVVECSHPAVRSAGAPRLGPCAFVCRALAVARRTISGGSIEIARGVVARLGFSVTQLGGNITLARGQPGHSTAGRGQLVDPRILAILGRSRAIVRRHLAVVDGSDAAVCGLSAARCGPGAFIGRAPAVARRTVSRGPVEITRGVVTRFGLSVAQLGRSIALSRGQIVNFAIPGSLRAILRRKLPIVDGLGTVVGSLRAPRRSLGTFVRRMLAVAGSSISRGSIKVTRRVVTCFGLSVAQPGGHVTVLRSKPCLAAAHARQLVGPGICAILGGLRSIFGRNPAVVDSLGAVVRGAGAA